MEQENRWYRGQSAVLKKNHENRNLPSRAAFNIIRSADEDLIADISESSWLLSLGNREILGPQAGIRSLATTACTASTHSDRLTV